MTEPLLSPREAAKRVGLSIRTVQAMMKRGEFPYCQVSKRRRMVPPGALAQWIRENTDWHGQSSTGSRHGIGMSSGERTAENVAYLHARPTDTKPNDS